MDDSDLMSSPDSKRCSVTVNVSEEKESTSGLLGLVLGAEER